MERESFSGSWAWWALVVVGGLVIGLMLGTMLPSPYDRPSPVPQVCVCQCPGGD